MKSTAKTKQPLFKPNGDLMSQLFNLTDKTAKKWYKEYLKYHNVVDQEIDYLIGYFIPDKRKFLEEQFKMTSFTSKTK